MNLDIGRGNAITCPNCHQPFTAQIEQIVDVGRDPSAKARFLSGQTNTAVCPHCQFRLGLVAPMLYHDPAKELLLIYVPVELALPQQEQERLTGQMVKAVMDATPAEKRRGYMFQPRPVLSLQSMIEAILREDGVTPEMLEAQRAKMRLVETLLQADDQKLPDLIRQHDDEIDMEFLQIMTLAAENAQMSGHPDAAERVLRVRDRVIELSAAGQSAAQEAEAQELAIKDVVQAIQELGEQADLDSFLNLVISYADDERRLQALVGLQFPAFDYHFFEALTRRIQQSSGEQMARLEALRDRLLTLVDLIRQQEQAMAQSAVQVLQDILASNDLEEGVRRNLPRIDDTFVMVLDSSIQAAEQRKDLLMSARLKQITAILTQIAQQNMPPQIAFINNLLQAESTDAARAMVRSEAAQFGPDLLPLIDSLMQELEARGDQNLLARLRDLRPEMVAAAG